MSCADRLVRLQRAIKARALREHVVLKNSDVAARSGILASTAGRASRRSRRPRRARRRGFAARLIAEDLEFQDVP